MFYRLLALFWMACSAGLTAQSVALSIESGSAAAGGTVTLPIQIGSSTDVAAVQWSIAYPADIVGLSVAAGGAATGAQKSVVCAGAKCLAYGLNSTPIANGTLATATFRIGSNASGAITIQLIGVSAASGSGAVVTASGGPGTITIVPRQTVKPIERAGIADSRAVNTSRSPLPVIAARGIWNAARRVTLDGATAPFAFLTYTPINAQVPFELLESGRESSTTSVVVTVESVSAAGGRTNIDQAMVAIGVASARSRSVPWPSPGQR